MSPSSNKVEQYIFTKLACWQAGRLASWQASRLEREMRGAGMGDPSLPPLGNRPAGIGCSALQPSRK
jgi:hypothetical protein